MLTAFAEAFGLCFIVATAVDLSLRAKRKKTILGYSARALQWVELQDLHRPHRAYADWFVRWAMPRKGHLWSLAALSTVLTLFVYWLGHWYVHRGTALEALLFVWRTATTLIHTSFVLVANIAFDLGTLLGSGLLMRKISHTKSWFKLVAYTTLDLALAVVLAVGYLFIYGFCSAVGAWTPSSGVRRGVNQVLALGDGLRLFIHRCPADFHDCTTFGGMAGSLTALTVLAPTLIFLLFMLVILVGKLFATGVLWSCSEFISRVIEDEEEKLAAFRLLVAYMGTACLLVVILRMVVLSLAG